ncbi:retinoic acid receptor beta-like [Haliotis rubra]|uniref:retinoic acid receptor beta-like n=1 Tax=Haliotis rubra TaxID=36100 RepID=UPI001EE6357C|nr:retinoic acid receptor beta-like [Haliotis rubra]
MAPFVFGGTSMKGSPKQKAVRNKTTGPPVKPAYLPPCRVCQSPASGIHYGIVTCEACKGFYRRNSMQENPYTCRQSGNCDLTRNRRCCSHCRFNKCVAVGMSKQDIRIGRYTLQTRTTHTLEVRKLSAEWASTSKEEDLCSNHKASEWSLVDTMSEDIADSMELQCELTMEMEKNVCQYIQFIKSVPGFNDLSSNDREQLIKNGRLEFLVLEQFPGYNRELNVASISMSLCYRADTLSRIWGKEYMAKLFVIATSLKRMNLSLTELVLVEGMCVISADRCALDEPSKVDSIRWGIVEALIHHMKKRHRKPLARFAKIIDRVTILRELCELDHKTATDLSQWHFMQQSQLLMEVYDL